MTAGLRYLLHELIDYAGLFPPASLDLQSALRNYRSSLDSPYAWILARFICPAARLENAIELWQELEPATPLRISALCGSILEPEFGAQLDQVGRIATRGRAQIEMIELRLPSMPDSDQDRALARMASEIATRDLDKLDVFLEANGSEAGQLIPRLKSTERAGRLGFKLRCGGIEAAAFPSVERVREVLASCVEHKVPFKATAGLHHPIRYFNSKIGVTSHGFINVFLAGLLAAISGPNSALIEGCLKEESPAHFKTSDESVTWAEHEITTQQIRDLRSAQMISLGSCSVQEPIEDLQSLRWLGAVPISE